MDLLLVMSLTYDAIEVPANVFHSRVFSITIFIMYIKLYGIHLKFLILTW